MHTVRVRRKRKGVSAVDNAPKEVVVEDTVVHRVRAAAIQAEEMSAPEWTWEQKQNWAADIQTAEALWVQRDYEGVVKHIGGMYGLSEEEALVKPEKISLKTQAERCMKVIGA